MKEKYIAQVKGALAVSRKQKKEIIRDLQEAFASAAEHGETERQVAERLGSPKDFAAGIHEQFCINTGERHRRKRKLQIGIALVIAAAAAAVAVLARVFRVPENAIGQADALTSMQVGGLAFDPFLLALLLGAVALAAAVVLIIFDQKSKNQ